VGLGGSSAGHPTPCPLQLLSNRLRRMIDDILGRSLINTRSRLRGKSESLRGGIVKRVFLSVGEGFVVQPWGATRSILPV